MGGFDLLIVPNQVHISVKSGTNLLWSLRENGLGPDAPCGGHGTCGKCRVVVDGQELLACQVSVDRNMTVLLPENKASTKILTGGIRSAVRMNPRKQGYLIAFDIGTTTVVCYLLDSRTGEELETASMLNPQSAYGADVVSRIQAAVNGALEPLCGILCTGMETLIRQVCERNGISPREVGTIAVVGNPAMQQLFLGIDPRNLAAVPFLPVLKETAVVPAKEHLPICPNAELLIVPDISGYVGADTIGCVLSTGQYASGKMILLVDIGTNGEMVLGNKHRMTACSTAAGPALEGARIKFGMRGTPGAIDHVWLEDGKIQCSVIGGGEAKGICGSGLIDAVAILLDAGLINKRGRIQDKLELDGQRVVYLTDEVYLTQDDIREVQLAKGAIAAGIALMAEYLGVELEQIDSVLLAGAFGSFLNPKSACRIGLLPSVLLDKIEAVGNAAGSGAKMIACDQKVFDLTQALVEKIEFIELAELPGFQKAFAKNMGL